MIDFTSKESLVYHSVAKSRGQFFIFFMILQANTVSRCIYSFSAVKWLINSCSVLLNDHWWLPIYYNAWHK